MGSPVDPSFGSHGAYTVNRTAVNAFRQASFTTPTNMYNVDRRPEPPSCWQRVTMRADSIRDAMGDRCCRCLHHMPSLVLIIGIILLVGLAIAAVPVAFVLISNAGQASELKGAGDPTAEGGAFFHPIRIGLSNWPSYKEQEMDNEEKEKEDDTRAISTAALFPPNVSLCHGFGFACTSQPSLVISTSARCDGRADCPDGSDETGCRECQTPFWCELAPADTGKARTRQCLRAEQLCDGVTQCSDGVDETSFCRPSSTACPAKTKRCANTPLCLPEESVCDGEPDCRNDDDETSCTSCNRGAKMCVPTGKCVPRSKLCDGVVNCPDASDELDCDCKSCSGSKQALCGNGRCMERSRVCDGIIDCEGGLDEQHCPGTCRAPAGNASVASSAMETKTALQCKDGQYYPAAEACSGKIRACAAACLKKCDPRLAFTCDDSTCIQKMKVCDGTPDCAGGEDERDCEKTCAAKGHFKCASGDKCVLETARCDGVIDCEDASDEAACAKCPSASLQCVPDKRCLPSTARCDGVADCSDGSDEADCTCQECTGSNSETYACESTKHCFRRDSVCAPYSKCPNATKADKLFCAAKALQKDLF